MSRHLTHRFWFCLLIGWGGLLLAVWSRSLEPAALAAPFLVAIGWSLADGWWPPIEVRNPTVSAPRVVEGDELHFTIEVDPPRPTWVDIELQLPAELVPTSSSRHVLLLSEPQVVAVELIAERWGAAGPEWVVLTTRDRLGLSERVVRVPLHLPVRVHPKTERLNRLIPLPRQRPVTGDHRARSRGQGSELAEVRPYRTGDPVRMVHPRLSARRNTPTVVERHPDQSSDVLLLVDSAQDLGADLDTTLRWTVVAAMALGERHLRSQDRVGLIDVGRGVRWLPARLGRHHLHLVVDTLLATEVLSRQELARRSVPASQVPPGATVIAISPLINETVLSTLVDLRSRGHEILVIRPSTPEPDDDVDLLARRVFRVGNTLNQRWLQERGVLVVPWQTGDPLDQVMGRIINNIGRTRTAGRAAGAGSRA
jgi:uncharacterized protein (DUF58 family)